MPVLGSRRHLKASEVEGVCSRFRSLRSKAGRSIDDTELTREEMAVVLGIQGDPRRIDLLFHLLAGAGARAGSALDIKPGGEPTCHFPLLLVALAGLTRAKLVDRMRFASMLLDGRGQGSLTTKQVALILYAHEVLRSTTPAPFDTFLERAQELVRESGTSSDKTGAPAGISHEDFLLLVERKPQEVFNMGEPDHDKVARQEGSVISRRHDMAPPSGLAGPPLSGLSLACAARLRIAGSMREMAGPAPVVEVSKVEERASDTPPLSGSLCHAGQCDTGISRSPQCLGSCGDAQHCKPCDAERGLAEEVGVKEPRYTTAPQISASSSLQEKLSAALAADLARPVLRGTSAWQACADSAGDDFTVARQLPSMGVESNAEEEENEVSESNAVDVDGVQEQLSSRGIQTTAEEEEEEETDENTPRLEDCPSPCASPTWMRWHPGLLVGPGELPTPPPKPPAPQLPPPPPGRPRVPPLNLQLARRTPIYGAGSVRPCGTDRSGDSAESIQILDARPEADAPQIAVRHAIADDANRDSSVHERENSREQLLEEVVAKPLSMACRGQQCCLVIVLFLLCWAAVLCWLLLPVLSDTTHKDLSSILTFPVKLALATFLGSALVLSCCYCLLLRCRADREVAARTAAEAALRPEAPARLGAAKAPPPSSWPNTAPACAALALVSEVPSGEGHHLGHREKLRLLKQAKRPVVYHTKKRSTIAGDFGLSLSSGLDSRFGK